MENEVKTGRIEQVNIDEQMRSAYIDYSMSVIVSRALPDVRDGFKPVHRRVLFGMDGLGLRHTSQTKKSARIVGEVLGKYHPHGDSSVYDAMARMAQDWSLRYPLVFGQGNFGSMDGDPVAAMRYTEAKLSKLSDEVLADLEKAEELLDEENDYYDAAYFTHAAAHAIHARMALYMQDWDAAIEHSSVLIDSDAFALATAVCPFRTRWSVLTWHWPLANLLLCELLKL